MKPLHWLMPALVLAFVAPASAGPCFNPEELKAFISRNSPETLVVTFTGKDVQTVLSGYATQHETPLIDADYIVASRDPNSMRVDLSYFKGGCGAGDLFVTLPELKSYMRGT